MAFSSRPEGEGASHRAYHQLFWEMHTHLDERLQAGAVLRNQVVDSEGPEGVHHVGDALAGQPGEVEAADHRVDLGHPRGLHGVAADADDTAVRARGHDDQPAVADVGDKGCSPMKVSGTIWPSR